MKIVFFGTPEFVNPVIDALRKNFSVVKVIRNPKELSNETIEQLNNLKPDFFVVASFGKILSGELLKIPKFGAINIHPSLLPKHRGASPIQTAILSGDKKTGVTFIKMDEKVDHGAIIEQFEKPILPDDTFETLAKRLFNLASDVLVRVLTRRNTWKLQPQSNSKASYTKLLTRDDGYIDISDTAQLNKLDRKIRAYFPWPGVWSKARLSTDEAERIIKFLPNQKIQVEGKREMSYKDFLNGYPNADARLRKYLEENV